MASKYRYLSNLLLLCLLAVFSQGGGSHCHEHPRALNLPSCASDCIENSGCDTSDIKCMCWASRGSFLPDVVACMYRECSQDISVDTWLTPLELACEVLGQPIPVSAISSAEAAQGSITNTKPTTATTTTVTSETKTVQPASTSRSTYIITSKATATIPRTPLTSTSTSTSTPAAMTSVTSSVTSPVTTDEQLSSTTSSSSQAPPEVATTTTSAYSGDPTDSSPFASPINSSAHHSGKASLLGATVIGLAAVIAFGL
ncbi:hypothetical protein BKA67DRAFT_548432 [Truncatella angustata]|uniref:CFEM domain-containing protein n=1 Tax=Truncatella angustata TaxID=152316 RepID=A0A9P9A559_9PEZI|nr:uncharacterized protein BKA67DRAFT_548432 [Truncatella angustata]KAH6660559.1 hypothetical protein BKA67DRAFT_548432 [Truncatella angustata]